LFLYGNAKGDNMMLLIAGIVLIISGTIGLVLQIQNIKERTDSQSSHV